MIGRFDRRADTVDGSATVAVDVCRATTTAATAVVRGFAVYPVEGLEAAVALAARLDRPLLAGELGGDVPDGFDLDNSPADMANQETLRLVERWAALPLESVLESKSVEYLHRTGCLRDLELVLEHVDDVDAIVRLDGERLVQVAHATR